MDYVWTSPSSSSMEKTPDDAVCWICLDVGIIEQASRSDDEEEPEPLFRQCACRGTSGYVHISCLTKLVEIDTNKLFDEELNSFVIPEDAKASKDPTFLSFGELFAQSTQDFGSFDAWRSGGQGRIAILMTFLCLLELEGGMPLQQMPQIQ